MKTRSAETKKTVESACGDSSTSTGLDEDLWGSLQYHIDLAEDVYPKLPFEEFFHLRTVCKDWYVIACKRLGLKEPIHKPFFNLIEENGYDGQRLEGILIYNALSRSWNWRSGWTHMHNPFDEFVASKGMVFSCRWNLHSSHASVFHWQSKIYQGLDPPPKPTIDSNCTVLGMIVSEKQGPSSSFKVVIGSPRFDTQVYESGVWQTKPCRVPKHEMDRIGWYWCTPTGCVDCNGRVYIISKYTRVIVVYDFENARWSCLRSPGEVQLGHPLEVRNSLIYDRTLGHTLGVWNNRIFDMTFQFRRNNKKEASSIQAPIQVWELVDEMLHKWKVYDCMPTGLLSWLRSTKGFLSLHLIKDEDICIRSNFCGGFMLVYSWNYQSFSAGRFCLFNIATKNWQKLNVVAGTVKMG